MNDLAWFLTGIAVSWAMGLTVALIADRELRQALLHMLGAMVMGPLVVMLVLARRGPSFRRMSPDALARFCRQVDSDTEPAWVLSYNNRGVILINRRCHGWWRNNVPNRVADAAGK